MRNLWIYILDCCLLVSCARGVEPAVVLDEFFAEKSHFTDKKVVEWVEHSDKQNGFWSLHILSRNDNECVRYSVVLPVQDCRGGSSEFLLHYGDTVYNQQSVIAELRVVSNKYGYDLVQANPLFLPEITQEIREDYGYSGLFSDTWNRGLAYVIVIGEYQLKRKRSGGGK